MQADALMPISVVVERRAGTTPWQDHVWRPVGVLPRVQQPIGAILAEGDGWAQIHGGALDLELFRGETEGYLTNLSQETPSIFVVLRPNDESRGAAIEPFIVTACPYEAMGYTVGGDNVVEGVPMTPDVLSWVREFVALHHVDEPFYKRKNKRHRDDYGGMARQSAGEEDVP